MLRNNIISLLNELYDVWHFSKKSISKKNFKKTWMRRFWNWQNKYWRWKENNIFWSNKKTTLWIKPNQIRKWIVEGSNFFYRKWLHFIWFWIHYWSSQTIKRSNWWLCKKIWFAVGESAINICWYWLSSLFNQERIPDHYKNADEVLTE